MQKSPNGGVLGRYEIPITSVVCHSGIDFGNSSSETKIQEEQKCRAEEPRGCWARAELGSFVGAGMKGNWVCGTKTGICVQIVLLNYNLFLKGQI